MVGLPGTGKSNLARGVAEELVADGWDIVHLEMDEQRKKYFPNPQYTPEEREAAYGMFAEEARDLTEQGKNVVMDGAAYKVAFREYAREIIDDFAEVHVKCTLDNAMKREAKRKAGKVMAGLYAKALERQRTGKKFPGLGEVIGVDVPFEENSAAEFVISNDDIPKEETRRRTMEVLRKWLAARK